MGPGILACCQALLAADAAEAEDNYRRSVELVCTTPITLAVARSLLVYREWLRHRLWQPPCRHGQQSQAASDDPRDASGFGNVTTSAALFMTRARQVPQSCSSVPKPRASR